MKGITIFERWGALWRSKNLLDGVSRHVMFREVGQPALFYTRKEAAAWIREMHGYIAHRPDLRREPHGWRVPIPVRVKITMRPVDSWNALRK